MAPSDIKEEVGIVKEVVNKWNDLNSEKEKNVLIPKHWASSTYPTAGTRPQESINKQIVDKSDLLICIFGARLGEPTCKALSGSIEEIDEHMKAKKPVMVFFKKSGSYDIDPAQLQKVKDYRESIQNKVLWVDYRDAEEFANIIADKIQLFLNDNLLEIYKARTDEGKCRVTEGQRDKYVKLLTQIGGDKANKIIEYLYKAQEVSEDFEEIIDLFDRKIEAKIEESMPKWENIDRNKG